MASDLNTEVENRISSDENIQNQIDVIGSGQLGSIKPTDAAPTPARNGNYTFSIGGNKPAWLTAEAGVTTVKAGDGVAVVYAAPSTYTYTHVDVSSDFVTIQELNNHEANLIHQTKIDQSENRFNAATKTADKYIAGNGVLANATPAGKFAVTDYIDWETYTELVTGKNGILANYYGKEQYDNAKVFIAGTHANGVSVSSLTKAAGAKYFRLTYRVAEMNQINFGNAIKAYTFYSKAVKKDINGVPMSFKPDMLDSALVAKFAELENQDALVNDKVKMVSRNGGQSYNEVIQINPTGKVWNETAGFTDKWFAIWLKGISTKFINRISIPIVKNFFGGLDFTDGLTVKIFHNGLLRLSKVIPFSEISPYNALTTASPLSSFLYPIDLPVFELKVDDILYIGVECNAAADKISMFYSLNGTPSDAAEWTRNYTTSGGTSGTIINLTTQPALPSSSAFYRVVKCYFLDYIGKQIDDKISGAVKQDLTIMAPKKIYAVFNDQLGTGENDLFNVRMYSIPFYFDSLVDNIMSEMDVDFLKSGNEKIQLYSPELTTNTSSQNKTLNFGKSLKYNDGSVSFIQKNVKESVGKAIHPKILCIGDSVTSGNLANIGLPDSSVAPSQYWSVIKEQFEKAKIDAGDNAADHNCRMVGRLSTNSWSLSYKAVSNRAMKTWAEGAGGWSSSDHLYYSRNWLSPSSQGFWDLLGLGNGTGTDYTWSSAQNLAIATTPEGLYAPKDTAAFLTYINVQLGTSYANYAEAVSGLNALEADPTNPFYDKTTAQGGVVAFSLTAYIDRYKTLASDGTTRLVVGSTAGTKVTNVNAYDVCIPTHIIIQHSHNDGDVSWYADNIRKWTDKIKAEYTANGWGAINIGLSVIRHTGTYYPQRYPMFDYDSIALWPKDYSKGFSNYAKLMTEFWVSDANEDTERIFLLPSLNVQPTAWSTPFRKLPSAEWDITGIEDHNFRVIDGSGPDWHPNAIAHRAWGMEMYAWIRYTLSID